MSRTILELHPSFSPQVGEWFRRCNAKGVPVLVYFTYRSPAEQERLYQIGRDDDGKRIPGGRIVTNAKAGDSRHNAEVAGEPASEAIDAVPLDVVKASPGKPLKYKLDWTPFVQAGDERRFREEEDLELLDPRWRVMIEAADKVGIDWAGRWTNFVEYVHFQMRRTS